MADIREMRIFTTSQLVVPPTLPSVLKDFSKEVLINNPQNIIQFSRQYFEKKLMEQGYPLPSETAAPEDKPADAEVEQTATE